MRINTNVASLNAQANSQEVQKNISKSLQKLASGLAINQAADNGAGLAIADKLRTQSSAISQGIKNANSGIAMIQIADKAMDEQSKILTTIKTKLVQAATDTTTSDGRTAIKTDINKLLEQFQNISEQTNYNGINLIGTAKTFTFQAGEDKSYDITTTIDAASDLTLGSGGAAAVETVSVAMAGISGDSGDSLTISLNGKDYKVTFDEVVNGFRISEGGAQQKFGIKPDITTLGKALGNGFTISAVGGKNEIMNLLSPQGKVYQASTFAGNPISVSAAISSIKTINKIKNKLYSKLERFNLLFSTALDDMATDMKIPHQINFTASMFQIFFTNKPVVNYQTSKNANAKKFQKLFQTLLKKGIFIAPSQFEVVFLSDAHTQTDLNKTLDAYHSALKSVKN